MQILLIVIGALLIVFLIAAKIFNFDLREITELLKDFSWYIIVGVVIVVTFTFIISFQITSGYSMSPNVEQGDIIIFNRLSSDYDRNKIITMRDKNNKSFIKRIIGLPGEKIEYKDNMLYINDEMVEEPFLGEDIETYNFKFTDICSEKDCPDGIIPKEMYLVLGDNRPHSEDSREFGLITQSQIKGIAIFRMWPLNKIGGIDN